MAPFLIRHLPTRALPVGFPFAPALLILLCLDLAHAQVPQQHPSTLLVGPHYRQRALPPLPQTQSPRRLYHSAIALAKRGIPYAYGGTSTQGMDCSASVQHLMQSLGVPLPRTSEAQANHLARQARLWRVAPGETEETVARRLRPGDLLFWCPKGRRGSIGHVMMFIGWEDKDRLRLWGAQGKGKKGVTGSGVDFFSYRLAKNRSSRLVAYGRPALPSH